MLVVPLSVGVLHIVSACNPETREPLEEELNKCLYRRELCMRRALNCEEFNLLFEGEGFG